MRSFFSLKNVLRCSFVAVSLVFIWSLTGAVWEPLAFFLHETQKGLGFLALGFLLYYMARPSFRDRCDKGLARLGEEASQLSSSWRLLGYLTLAEGLAFMAVYKHNSLQSHAHDLGILVNVAWNVAYGNGFYDPLIHVENFLGDHFSPVMALFAPILWIWPDARPLLAAQGFAVAGAAWGIYRFGRFILKNRRWSALVAVMYLFHPFFNKMHRFDFHPEALSIPLIVWGVYFFFTERPRWGLLFLVLTWGMKEDLPIATFGTGLALLMTTRHKKESLILMIGSVAMFLFVAGVAMPHFLGSAKPTHIWRYSHMGDSMDQVVKTLLFRPHFVIWHVVSDVRVWRTAFDLLIPFLGLPLLGGWFTAAAMVGWSPHVISNYVDGQRTLSGPYSTAILALLALGTVWSLARVLKGQGLGTHFGGRILKWGPLVPLALATIYWAFNVPRYFKPISSAHVKAFHHIISLIPPEAGVSAMGDLGPHVAYRKQLTLFPDLTGADYILLEPDGNSWNLDPRPFDVCLDEVLRSKNYQVISANHGFMLLKKK